MNSERHLSPAQRAVLNENKWHPGECGNLNGRPKGVKSITRTVYEVLNEQYPGKEKTNLEILARVIVREALRGKFPFVQEIMNRLEGKQAMANIFLTEEKNLTVNVNNLSDEELNERLAKLIQETGTLPALGGKETAHGDEGSDPTPQP